MGRAHLVQRDVQDVLHVQRSAVRHADAHDGETAGAAHLGEPQLLRARHAHDRTSGRLAEQLHERLEPDRQHDARPHVRGQGRLDQGLRQPPVGQVVRAGQHAVARPGDEHLGQHPLPVEVDDGRRPAQVPVLGPGPLRPSELLPRLTEQQHRLPGLLEAHRRTAGDVVEQPQHADHRRRVDGGPGGGVVEADVATGHGGHQRPAAVGEPTGRLGELPHHLRILGAAEVQAVGDGDGHRAGGSDVAVRLGQRELSPCVRVEPGEAPVAVGREGDAQPGLLGQAHDPGVLRPGEHGVTEHDPVVLLDDPAAAAQVRGGHHPQQQGAEVGRGGVGRGGGRPQRVEVGRPCHRPLVDRAVVGERAGGHVDDDLVVPGDDEPVAVGHLPDGGRDDPPLGGDRQHGRQVRGRDDGQHALLRLAGEHLVRLHRRLAQRHPVELRPHPGPTRRRRLGQGAGQAGAAEVLDALDELRVVELQTGLDEQLLGERVTHLHGRALGRPGRVERRGGQHGHAADAVATGLRPEQHDHVADTPRGGQLDAVDRHHAQAQRVDERVALVAGVEHDLAADVGQAQAVPVAADARDDPGQHPLGVGVVGVTEAQRVHDQDRTGPHGEDVAHDPADAGRGTLVGLDVGRVVVRLDLEGDREALADGDHTGVLTHADEHAVPHCLWKIGGEVGELAQMHLAALVGAVLAPHDRVHRQLGLRRAPAEHGTDGGVLVRLQAQLGVRLGRVGGADGGLDGVHDRRCHGPEG